ncbi:hypothetical protein QBC47DRAFT_351273 [Echria macrotheca]|uniref:Rhodopsin domain-containing protein n=1 Tax=Echria macrotheca TaxID=438768 RepID=A0AAJ0B4V0_9PEZI|nr:hypothetical protein QBC47DRAFT_351273 [Echria macrotheca]
MFSSSKMAVLPRQAPPPPTLPPSYNTAPLLNQPANLLGLIITFLACSWICTLLRLYIRLVAKRSPGCDDFFIVLTMMSTTCGTAALCIMTNMGLGKPISALSLKELQAILKPIYIVAVTFPVSSTFVKLALLLQYLAAFPGRRIRPFCKAMLAIVTLHGAAFFFLSVFSCWPIPSFWDFSIPGHCWGFASRDKLEFMRITITQVATNATLDLVILLIPVCRLFRRDSPTTTKWSLLGLFALGIGSIVCGFWRVAYLVDLKDRPLFDPIWDNPTVMGLASVETHLAAVCSALPVLWPALKTTWNRILVQVTYEVRVTQEYGVFQPRKQAMDMELQDMPEDRDLDEQPEGWDPYVGDENTGIGENETVVEALPVKKPARKGSTAFLWHDGQGTS